MTRLTFQSIDPDLPAAGHRLERLVYGFDAGTHYAHPVVSFAAANCILTACGFTFVKDTLGDKIYSHANGTKIRMQFINSNYPARPRKTNWQLRIEEE